jgi:hypothetical protein
MKRLKPIGLKKPKQIKMNTTESFRMFLYSEKAKNPDKTLYDIMDDLVRDKRKKQNEKLFPNI